MAETQSNVRGGAEATSDKLRNDIRHTRDEMDETLDEIGERLHPRRLLDEILELFKPSGATGEGRAAASQLAATVKYGGKSVSRYARDNPISTLLMATGVAWAVFDAAKDDDEDDSWQDQPIGDLHAAGTAPSATVGGESLAPERSEFWDKSDVNQPGVADQAKHGLHSAKDSVSSAASAAAGKVRSAGARTWQQTKRAGRRGYGRTGELTSAAGDYMERGIQRTKHGAGVARRRFDEASEAYPLAVAGGFVAAGLLAGLLLPRTRAEDEWMGDASDEAWETAKSRGEELAEKGKKQAAQTASAAMHEAEAQGLTPEKLTEKAGRVAAKVGAAAKEEGVDADSLQKKTQKVGTEVKKAAQQRSSESRPRPSKPS